MSEKLQEVLVPKAGNYYKTRESFDSGLGVITDPVGMAEVLSRLTVSQIYTPERLNRVNQAYLSDKEQLSVTKLTDKVLAATLFSDIPTGPELGVWMRVNAVTLDSLLSAYHNDKTRPEVKAQLAERLTYTVKQLKRKAKRVSAYESAHFAWLQHGVEKGLTDAKAKLITKPLALPPGSPI